MIPTPLTGTPRSGTAAIAGRSFPVTVARIDAASARLHIDDGSTVLILVPASPDSDAYWHGCVWVGGREYRVRADAGMRGVELHDDLVQRVAVSG